MAAITRSKRHLITAPAKSGTETGQNKKIKKEGSAKNVRRLSFVKQEDSSDSHVKHIKIEIEDHEDQKEEKDEKDEKDQEDQKDNEDKKDQRVHKPPNCFTPVTKDDLPFIAPKNWDKIYNEIVYMRSKFMAPVDTQGCASMPNTIDPNIKSRDPKIYRFQLLVSLMLSSQTKDETNFHAMTKLHQGLMSKGVKEGLCLDGVLQLSEEEIDRYISGVGFHKRKAYYIKKTCSMLKEKFNGDIPKTIDDVVSLPGVGPKMGYLLIQNGWGAVKGIGVDVHVHRFAQMWGWASKSNNPEKTRVELERWLPKKFWVEINPLLVGFGQVICVQNAPNCDICTLARKDLCKGVVKKLLNNPISEKRLVKLKKQRADLSQLIEELF